jgi:hypothetical protein
MTDDGGRYAANVVIGTHFADRSGDIYLLNSEIHATMKEASPAVRPY